MTVAPDVQHIMEAGGSLPRAAAITHPEALRRYRLLIELGLVFIGAPVAIRYVVYVWHVPLFLVLQPVLTTLILYLLWDRTFGLRRELYRGFSHDEFISILLLFLVTGGIITTYVELEMPDAFLAFPTLRPNTWLLIMLLYPVMSVMAQEIVYRTFFFHRYGPLFGNARWLAILVNGFLFGFAHIIFGSYVAIALTCLLGWLLAWRYERTRSFWAVWLEHTLYGNLIFTVGLGSYFFTGVAALR